MIDPRPISEVLMPTKVLAQITASRSLATALWRARFASGLLRLAASPTPGKATKGLGNILT
jgi:hypothetical protein